MANEEEDNFNVVLGLVKTIKMDSLDANARKSLELLQGTNASLMKACDSIQKDIVTLYASDKDEAAKRMEERLDKLLELASHAYHLLIGVSAQLCQSATNEKSELEAKIDSELNDG